MENLSVDQRLAVLEKATIPTKTVLSFREAVAYTGYSKSSLYKKTMAKEIPFVKPGGKLLRFSTAALDEWLASNKK